MNLKRLNSVCHFSPDLSVNPCVIGWQVPVFITDTGRKQIHQLVGMNVLIIEEGSLIVNSQRVCDSE